MTYHGLPTWHVSLELSDDVGGFDFNTLPTAGYTAGIDGSFYAPSDSAYAPSSYGPLTPSSDQSTPSFSGSFNFGSSFASSVDPVPFDLGLTPPPSTTYTRLPMTPMSDSFSDSAYHVFPATPTRQLGFTGQALSTPGSQLAPSQTMDYLVSQLGSQSLISAPSAVTRLDRSPNAVSQWTYPNSPISLDRESPKSVNSNDSRSKRAPSSEDDAMEDVSATTSRRRALLAGARQRTTALRQQVEQWSPASPTSMHVRIKRERKTRVAVPKDGESPLTSVSRRGTFKCIFGCKKVYLRKEHMVRHVKTKHDSEGNKYDTEAEKVLYCNWCPHKTNREDNWRSHLKLHIQERPTTGGNKPRVQYFEGAVLEYQEVMKRIHQKRKGTKPKKRSNSAASMGMDRLDGNGYRRLGVGHGARHTITMTG
ncbi:hypothetical protein N657DRAFT_467440 [Parathielavia appendiculata]|uniref:C2H2-type domain-containing protein n=1 Tax=Parathielavia appendiculata TaxID=2587402 RepID=A0AAN6TXJ3_9PEZI|nr:hypothetical protein N657DRAFT_467440 [Parathielavia appendiculata]